MKIAGSLLLVLFLGVPDSVAQEIKGILRDTTDNAFDISRWILELNGFVPLVMPITEPAVGYGVMAAGAVFIPKKPTPGSGKFIMPDIAGAAAGLTENGTWFAGAGYIGFWAEDKIRYRGIMGYSRINLTYYGKRPGTTPTEFRMNSSFLLQQGLFRMGNSHFMIGGKYQLSKTTVDGLAEGCDCGINPEDKDVLNSGLGIIAEYENFNNLLSPDKGLRMQFSYVQFIEFLGSDRENGRGTLFIIGHQPVNKFWNAGIRVETSFASERTPFYLKPFVSLRGVPALRYQGDWMLLGETEHRFNIYRRWSTVFFGGYGITGNRYESGIAQNAWNAGTGFRYLIARILGLQMGMDLARGPEDWAVYITFGSAWNR